jgi:hypothetical protein
VQAKQRGENDSYKHTRQGEPKILQPNRFVMRGKDVAREKRGTGGLVRAGAVVVSDHFLYSSAIGGTLNLSPYLSANPQNCKVAETMVMDQFPISVYRHLKEDSSLVLM